MQAGLHVGKSGLNHYRKILVIVFPLHYNHHACRISVCHVTSLFSGPVICSYTSDEDFVDSFLSLVRSTNSAAFLPLTGPEPLAHLEECVPLEVDLPLYSMNLSYSLRTCKEVSQYVTKLKKNI